MVVNQRAVRAEEGDEGGGGGRYSGNVGRSRSQSSRWKSEALEGGKERESMAKRTYFRKTASRRQ
jgi:hypothetical protein